MCIGSAIRTDIRVSIQDRNAPDRAAGHLATGILADGDVVLVPNAPEAILDPGRDLEIIIFPTDIDEHSRIDVLDGWKWGRFALRGERDRPTAASVRLRHHSSYAAQAGAVEAEALASTLEELGGDLWAALARLEAIAPEIRDIDPALLARVSEIERAQRQPKRTEHEFESYHQMTPGWCIFFCFCHTHPGK
ncbi:MAG TPA: hypothetical protein VF062_03960 [Candidatus Limnocylindrales bacterium]